MCWQEHIQESGLPRRRPGPSALTLMNRPVDRGWIHSPDRWEHSWGQPGKWKGCGGGGGEGLNQRGHSSMGENRSVHVEKKQSHASRGVQGSPAALPLSPVSATGPSASPLHPPPRPPPLTHSSKNSVPMLLTTADPSQTPPRSARLAFTLVPFLQHTKLAPTPGPLYLLLSLPQILCPPAPHVAGSFPSCRIELKYHHFPRALPDRPV